MRTLIQVLSENERSQVHERSLEVLAKTGVRVDTALGRQILKDAGAEVDESSSVVRFPRALVEESLRLAPKEFSLGARRPGWDLEMNKGDCTLCIDGEATTMLDHETGERRPGTFDEVGMWWSMLEPSDRGDSMADVVRYTRSIIANFSKHIQHGITTTEQAPWYLEVIQAVFGDKETIRRTHPVSFLLCPLSPLGIEGPYTDAYLELLGWDIPVAAMPMPLMGGTSPASLISTIVQGNCEVLSMLCLIEAGAPGTPFLYAPALAVMDPRSGRYSPGAIEGAVLGSAAIEMARYYGLPAEGTGGGTECYVPSIQAGYERAAGAFLPMLSWPDVLVGPGLLGGSMILSLEQLLIDVEVFRMAKQAYKGIDTSDDKWLLDVIDRVGPAGTFMGERSTRKGVREGEWYVSTFGLHDTYEKWDAAGRPPLLDEARQRVDEILAAHEPLPLDEDVERELDRIEERARAED